MHKLGRQHLKEAEELNITAFMNLMVILVPFLLITAVFSRMTVLGLNLPEQNVKHQKSSKIKLSLEIVLKKNGFDIQDANIGLIKKIERTPKNTDWKQFDKDLLAIKRRFPDATTVSLLVEPNVPYKTLIHVMDHVKSTNIIVGTSVKTVQLFPGIAIGNAQPDSRSVIKQNTSESDKK